MITIHPDVSEVLCTMAEIRKKCRETGKKISKDYKDKDLLMIGLLKGATPYFMELIKHVTVNPELDFMKVSSYQGVSSTGNIKIEFLDEHNLQGKDVLIVEDIIDTGYTLSCVIEKIKAAGAKSVAVTAMLDKPKARKYPVAIKYLGFMIPDRFVVGFGLDYNQKYRTLPYVGVLRPEIYTKSKEDL